MNWAHPEAGHSCMHARTHIQYHIDRGRFFSSAFLIRHHTPLNESLLVSDSLLIPFNQSPRLTLPIALVPRLSVLFCCFHDNSGRDITQKDSTNGIGSYLGGCIIGVSGAGSLYVCACFRLCACWGGGEVHVHICTCAFVLAQICAVEHRDEWCVTCFCDKGSCTVSLTEMACETRRWKGCWGILKEPLGLKA